MDDSFGPTATLRPFSFVYGGLHSTGFLAGWTSTSSSRVIDARRIEHTFKYTDPATRLEVRGVVTEYTDYPAAEWVLYFKNTGPTDTPILENILPLNTTIASASPGQSTLYYADGSHLLVSDFQPRQAAITSTPTTLTSLGGRSSDGTLPFFNVAQPDGSGVVIGVGWTGQWQARFAAIGDKEINVQAGMEFNHFKLHPGEEVRSPAMLLLFWSGGDRTRAQNDLRRMLWDHYTPRPGGSQVSAPICASPYGTMPLEATTETNQVQAINNLAANNVPVDVWWLDAGWYPCDGTWVKTGTWEPDPVRYPRGLKPVANAAHTNGMQFLLWFEPERAMTGTWLYNNHADWLIGPVAGSGLLNLGNPAALNWAKTNFDAIIRDVGIDIYRQDLNGNDPMVYWKLSESPDRLGIIEIKYITGLYEFFDYLLERNPNLVIDNCSSGGRRIDFEMLRRATVMTRSDYTEPTGMQCQTYGLSQWIPLTGYGCSSSGLYNFRSGLGSFTTLSFDWYNDPGVWEPTKRMLGQYQSVKHLFTGDFYTLTPYSTAADAWIAWEYHRPELGEGIVQVFARSGSPVSTMQLKLQGLASDKMYSVQDVDNGALTPQAGIDLMTTGLKVQLAPGQSAMFHYKLVPVTVVATASRQAGLKPLPVQFTSQGTAMSGDPITYHWNFGDGGTSEEQNPSHTYAAGGRYVAEVTVNDGKGNVDNARLPVTVVAAPGKMKLSFPGYNRAEVLTSFPVLAVFGANLTANGFTYSQVASSNGWDLVFLNADETLELNHEIETWNPSGSSYVWIQLPQLTTNTCIWAYWGDTNMAGAAAACTTNGAVWANGYAGVWHLSEGSGNAYDSTAHRTPGLINTSYGACAQNAPAKVGSGYAFGGGYLTASAAVLPSGADPRTVSAWFKKQTASPSAPNKEILGYGNNVGGQRFGFWISGSGVISALGVENCGSARSFPWSWDNQWHQLVALLPNGQSNLNGLKLYYDGAEKTSATGQGPISTARDELCLGAIPLYHTPDRSYDFDGILDEVRIANVARSANWVWAEWLTVASNAVFTACGPVLDNRMDAYDVPNWWKLHYFGSVTGPGTASLEDWDHDGMANLHEYLAGTVPTNAVSLLALSVSPTITVADANFALQWQSVLGKSYSVEACTNLATGNSWRPVALDIPGCGGFNTWTGLVSLNHEFFRLKLR